MSAKLRRAIIKTIKKECEPSERDFPTIQTRLLQEYPDIGYDGGELKRNYTDKDVYEILLSLQDKYGVTIAYPEIREYVNLDALSIRIRESFGLACKDIPSLYKRLRTSKEKEVEYCGAPERGYMFFLVLDGDMCILKPFQRQTEKQIAPHASRAGLGPKVYGTGDVWLFEEFLKGEPISRLEDSSLAGHLTGNFFRRLHKENIALEHHRFPEELMWNPIRADLRMIDFGTARYTNDFKTDYEYIQDFFEKLVYPKSANKAFEEEYKS